MLEIIAVIWCAGCLIFVLSKENNPKAFRNLIIGAAIGIPLSFVENLGDSPLFYMALAGAIAASCSGLRKE